MALEDQVSNLVIEIQQLVRTLGATSNTQGLKSTDRNTKAVEKSASSMDKLVTALGIVAQRLEKNSQSKQIDYVALQKFSQEVDDAAKAQQELSASAEQAAKDIADAAEKQARAAYLATLSAKDREREEEAEWRKEQAAKAAAAKAEKDQNNKKLASDVFNARRSESSSRAVFEQFNGTAGMAERLKNNFLDMAGDSKTMQAVYQLTAGAVEGMAKSALGFSGALLRGERGAKVSAKALTDLATPVLNVVDVIGQLISVLSWFLPGGKIVKGLRSLAGGLLQGASAAGKVALKLNELAAEQADALFKSFQQLSTVGAAGARGMDDVFETLQTLGMSVAEIEKFNSLITQNGQKLIYLGTTAAQGARAFAQVAGELYKSPIGQQLEMLGINAEEQREAALVYMNIQARTGQLQLKSTQQLVQESAKFAKELDLAATLTGQTRKEQAAAREAALAETRFRAALVSARQRGDTGEIQRLEAAQQAAALAKAFGDERGFTGILQYAAGGMTTPEAVAAEMTYRVSQILARPNMSQMEMAQLMSENVKLQQEQLASSVALVGNIDPLMTGFTATGNMVDRIVPLMEEANKQGLRGPDALQKVLETEQGKRILAGGDTEAMVKAGRLQQSAALTQEAALNQFNIAAQINEAASKAFNEAVQLFARTVRARPVPGGTPTTVGSTADELRSQLQTGMAGTSSGGAGGAPTAGGSVRGTPVYAGGETNATTPQGPRVYRGGVMGAVEDFVTGGRGFRSYGPEGEAGAANQRKILDFIGRIESNGNYNVLVGGKNKTDPPLTDMTVGQVLDFQTGMKQLGFESTAVGKYQIIRPTLSRLFTNGVVKYSDKFDAATQDKLALALLEGRGYRQYQAGDISAQTFASELAKEWASLPMANGKSYYDKQGSNRALVSYPDFINALTGARMGGIFRGPESGYTATLHGTEAVVPLPDGKKIPVDLDVNRMSFDINSSFESLRRDLRELIQNPGGNNLSPLLVDLMMQMVDLQRRNNATADRLLQISTA